MDNQKRHWQVWRKNKTIDYYPGGYSVSSADHLSFLAFFHFKQSLDPLESPSIYVSYTIDGDTMERWDGVNPLMALKWIEERLKAAIDLNMKAIEKQRDIQED